MFAFYNIVAIGGAVIVLGLIRVAIGTPNTARPRGAKANVNTLLGA